MGGSDDCLMENPSESLYRNIWWAAGYLTYIITVGTSFLLLVWPVTTVIHVITREVPVYTPVTGHMVSGRLSYLYYYSWRHLPSARLTCHHSDPRHHTCGPCLYICDWSYGERQVILPILLQLAPPSFCSSDLSPQWSTSSHVSSLSIHLWLEVHSKSDPQPPSVSWAETKKSLKCTIENNVFF